MKGFMSFLHTAGEKMLAYTTEEGSRQYVWAAVGGSRDASPSEPGGIYTNDQLHGQYTSASKVQEVADYVLSAEGTAVQARIWVRVLLTMFLLSLTRSRRTRLWKYWERSIQPLRPTWRLSSLPFGFPDL